jgi:hypothetical protein
MNNGINPSTLSILGWGTSPKNVMVISHQTSPLYPSRGLFCIPQTHHGFIALVYTSVFDE